METDYEDQELAWLVVMASTKGWESYAWHKARKLSSCYPGIDQRLLRIMRENKSAIPKPQAESKQKER